MKLMNYDLSVIVKGLQTLLETGVSPRVTRSYIILVSSLSFPIVAGDYTITSLVFTQAIILHLHSRKSCGQAMN